MSRGVNKVILVGNVGKDPEIKYTASGAAIANFSIATSESWNDKTSGEKVEKTEWTRCVAFQRTAEVIGEYVTKGMQIYCEGKLQTRKWQDKDGQDRWTTEVVVSSMQMLGGKGESKPDEPKASDSGFRKPATANDFADDDIPF